MTVLQGLAAVALLGVSAWLISRAAEVSSIVYLGVAIVGVRGFAVARATFRYVERLLLHESAFRMLGTRRPQIFARLAPFIPVGISQTGRGETIARVVNDVDELQNLSLRVIAPLVQSIVAAAASILFLWLLLPTAGLALLVSVSLAFVIAVPISARFAKASDSMIAPLKARMADQCLDLLENQDVYIAYGWMDVKSAELKATDQTLKKAIAKSAISNGLGSALFTAFSIMAVLGGAWFGGEAVLSGVLPGASLAVFTLMPLAIFEVLQAAQPAISAYRRFRVSAERVSTLLTREIPSALKFEAGTEPIGRFETIDLLDVSIRYPSASKPAITAFNLSIRPGESMLLSGESGVGKTSIGLLLSRMIQPDSGVYLINGQPVGNFGVDAVRRVVGLVEQNPMIFLGDVRANLALAKPGASDEELIHVLQDVGLWSMFKAREGLATQLGDRGVLISGGEAQRLGLARAILADFEVLILDEPTANLDSATADKLIRDLLRVAKSRQRRSIILISHEERFRALVDREVRLSN